MKIMFKIIYISYILLLLHLSSCNILDNDQPLPFFLELKEPTVKLPNTNIYDTHKITDVWVFADGQILGVFPLPAKVPLSITNSVSEVTILAGIRKNGMNDTPVFYPFYKSIVTTVNPKANEGVTIPLDFEYIPDAKIPISESFELGNSFTIDLDKNPETNLQLTSESSILGSKSGLISLTSTTKFIEAGCSRKISSGENSRGQSYIELDYKGEGEIAVGIAKSMNGVLRIEYVLFVPAKENWNKIYVDVTDKLSPSDYNEYFIILAFTRTGNSQISNIYVDNIKHIHF